MPNRILKESICTSPELNLLAPAQENLFYRLIVNCDDYGCMQARPSIVRSKCYPLLADVITLEEVVARLVALAQVGLIMIYLADNLPYLKLTKWECHQQIRAKRPRYPLPTETTTTFDPSDINCKQLLAFDGICPRNPIRNPIQYVIQSNPSDNGHQVLAPDINCKQNDRPEIFTLYEQNIGLLSPLISDVLMEAEKEYPAEWIKAAFQEAAKANVRRWRYVEKCLDNWRLNGFDGSKPQKASKDYEDLKRRRMTE